MKILYYSPHPNLNLQDLSGYGTHMREMISAFSSLGHSVFPLIAGGTEKRENILIENPAKKNLKRFVPGLFWESAKDLSLIRFDHLMEKKLLEQIDKFKPDLIYERGNYLQLSGGKAAQKAGINHLIEFNSPYTEERVEMMGKSLFLSKSVSIEKKQMELSGKVIVVSSALKQYFMDKHGIQSEKILVIPNAIRPDKINTSTDEILFLKNKYRINNHFVVGFVGSVFPYHGVDLLIKSFKSVLEKVPGMKLLIVGGGETLSKLIDLSEKMDLGDSVIFTGSIPNENIFNHISLMDICVLPNTNWYMSPIKIFEYGFLGKAIVAPDYSPLRDVLVADRDAVLIKPGAENLSAAILKLYGDKALMEFMGANFRQKVLNEHTWIKMAQKIIGSIN